MLRIDLSKIVLTSILALGLVTPADAQTVPAVKGSDTLEALLRYVPNLPTAREWLSYADYSAAAAARGFEPLSSFSEFAEGNTDPRTALWMQSMPSGGMALGYFGMFDKMPEVLGVDFFAIGQSLQWGLPPDVATVLRGDFDEASIRDAHLARGFTEIDLDGVPAWCSPDGCNEGLKMDISAREPADVFGGDLGRKFPRALDGDVLFAAGLDTTLTLMRVTRDSNLSILSDKGYQAAVQALDGDFYLRAVQFVPSSAFTGIDIAELFNQPPDSDRLAEMKEQMLGDDAPLPLFNFAVLADTAGAVEAGHLLLIYPSASLAAAAAATLEARLDKAVSLATDRPWAELITERNGTIEPITVETFDDLGYAVVHLTLTKPLPSNDEGDTGFEASGLMFRLLFDGLARRDLGWLTVG